MFAISTLNRSIRAAAASLVLIGLLSPANAGHQHDAASVLSDRSISAAPDHAGNQAALAGSRSMLLTSRLPWLAPVGHRQPRRDDVPSSSTSAWERQQQQLDHELDRKLIICRGC
ncbi:hypothetical protein JIR23_21960 [Bradyrhizobium diazoefficiens]|nr:hypothetical protein [Bradyrhizobium diazoefficiens]QQN62250.1 hypothetical protein JIR23_21960 [Bradyrhizobium diazoefficiens]